MAPRRPPAPDAALVQRKRSGVEQIRKTVYFLPETAERLDRYAFENRRKLWDIVEEAVREYLDRHAPAPSKRRTSRPPTSTPPATRKSTVPPRSRRA